MILKKVAMLLVLLMLAIVLGSCASIIKGTSQKIAIDSNVKGAKITVNGKYIGTTPAVVTLKNQSLDATVELTKDGYDKKVILIKSKTSGWFWANIIVGGVLGSSTDSSTGGMYAYAKNKYYIEMPTDTSFYQKKAKLRYFALMNYDRINKDIAQNQGEYLNTVCVLMGVTDKAGIQKMLPYLKRVQKNSKSIVEFANQLVSKI